jgi:hypothetical protein
MRLAALLLGLPAGGHGFGFSVGAGQRQCFDELAKSSERVAGEWRVVSGGSLDLDVTVCNCLSGRKHGLSPHRHVPTAAVPICILSLPALPRARRHSPIQLPALGLFR